MKRILAITGSLFLFATALGDAAWAQIPQYSAGPSSGAGGPSLKRSTRPVVSPYAGLLGSGVGANIGIGYQYFTRVQPQLQASRAIGSLGRSVNRLQAQSLAAGGMTSLTADQQLLMQQQAAGVGIGPTGHSVSYLSHTSYFGTNLQKNSGAGGGGGSSSGGPSASSSSPNPSVPVRR
jgi:hypothetical protein